MNNIVNLGDHGNIETVTCIYCNRPFQRYKRGRNHHRLKGSVRKSKTITCSKLCSSRYHTIKAKLASQKANFQKLKGRIECEKVY